MAKAGASRKPVVKPAAGAVAAETPLVLPAWLRAVHKFRGYIAPMGFILLMGVLLVPLPPAVMDILIVANISLSVVILLTTIYMNHPLDFSVFPSLLLATTLLRLVLNVASTRLILTADASTPEQAAGVAGHVIMAFGQFVAGDSLFVGVVIFLIMVIVQFMVITKGATRISEVAARFTLDAMPGKQMAIDADLNAGVIDDVEARRRRERVAREADFFGAMDGASKFVRGDAIAGLIITIINVLGGFAVGVFSRGWDVGQTAKIFTTLTIGDGLSAQIPSFVIAIASALIVTRSGSKEQLGHEMADQVISQPRGLLITGGFLALLSFTPLPTIPLLVTGGAMIGLAIAMGRAVRRQEQAAQAPPPALAPELPPVENLLKVDVLELEVGYGLVQLVDKGHGGDLLDRISAVRRQLAAELGLVMPPVRIRDNVQQGVNDYRVKIRGSVVASGQVKPGRLMAMDSGITSGTIEGEQTREPAFGLDAWWIDPALRARAETMNYTVVDPTSVLATHITEIVRKHADELLTRDEVSNLIEQLKQTAPKLIEETIPGVVKPVDVQKILQNLLRERVPIKDLETILETLSDWGTKTKDLDVLTEYVRNALRRTICHQHAVPQASGQPKLACVTLDPALEDQINAYIDRGPGGTTFTMPAKAAARVADQVGLGLRKLAAQGHHPVVIASPQVRAIVRQILEPHVPGVAVLGYNEVAAGVEVESAALIGAPAEAPVAA
ncbi:MAG: flagellar biosynthesis protein FlhA [Phycisphaerales bacterium]